VTSRKEYEKLVDEQLQEWKSAAEALRDKLAGSQAEEARAFKERLDALSAKIDATRQKYETLVRTSSSDEWGVLKAKLDANMTDLQRGFGEAQDVVQQAGEQGLSWAKGITDEHFIQSIGWAAGFSEEKIDASAGWAEGLSEDDATKSKGWGEGYDQSQQT
jgi:hypothetical protein